MAVEEVRGDVGMDLARRRSGNAAGVCVSRLLKCMWYCRLLNEL